ncbi:hypothetical protein AB0F17_65710 [Nonomuraea sp. NPDC026600]|uniref:hypothetical protein n=1 Tax=Nonomuraea sp. NPDC026600 TaxID=3155363 RepID=UPI0033C83152
MNDIDPELPTRYHDITGDTSTTDMLRRYQELSQRQAMVEALAILQARGTYDATRHGPADQPLSVEEHLALLAFGEALARAVRHPVDVVRALRAGASWEQVAEARGQEEQEARQEYRQWAEGQRRLRQHYGDIGMTEAEYAEAIARADQNDHRP